MSRQKIILFHPRTFHERNYRYYHIPYSLLAIATPLDLAEFDVVMIDNNVNKGRNYEDVISQMKNEILCVGISCMIGAQIKDALRFAEQVREVDPTIPIIWGGPLPTMLPEVVVRCKMVDIVVRGQGEITFNQLVDRLERDIPWKDVLGISYICNGEVEHNTDRPFDDLNRFPPYLNVYRLINVENYIWPDEHIASRTVSYHSSQGCPYSCGFCCDVPLWKRWWSGLSPERILNDVQYLVGWHEVNGVKFYDSEFFIDLRRAMKFAQGLLERKIRIKWAASVHPRNLHRIKPEQIELLARSGLRRLLVGVESVVPEEIDLIRKNIRLEMVLEIATRCRSMGIIASFTFIIGYPFMPDENVDKNLSFARKLAQTFPEHEFKLHLYAPYPATPLYPLAIKCGLRPPQSLEEWAAYDYYEITTPWAKPEWVEKIREFNEKYYPYIKYPISRKSVFYKE